MSDRRVSSMDPAWDEAPAGVKGLIAAGRDDAPGRDVLARVASRLPLGTAAGSGGSGAAAPSPPQHRLAGADSASGGTALPITAGAPLVKLAGALLVVAAVAVAALALRAPSTPDRRGSAPEGPLAPAPTAVTGQVPRAEPASEVEGPAQNDSVRPSTELAASAPPPPSGSTVRDRQRRASPSASRLAERPQSTAVAVPHAPAPPAGAPADELNEVDLLDRAARQLQADPRGALALATDHERRFPRSAMTQEREVIAIEALVQIGRPEEARARAARFLREHPASAHRRRIERLVSQ